MLRVAVLCVVVASLLLPPVASAQQEQTLVFDTIPPPGTTVRVSTRPDPPQSVLVEVEQLGPFEPALAPRTAPNGRVHLRASLVSLSTARIEVSGISTQATADFALDDLDRIQALAGQRTNGRWGFLIGLTAGSIIPRYVLRTTPLYVSLPLFGVPASIIGGFIGHRIHSDDWVTVYQRRDP